MTALACCVQDLGIKITGSDVEEVFVTDKILKQRKIGWQIGFGEKNLKPKPDLLITTGAHGGLTNPEVIAAGKMGIPVLTHAQALGKLMEGKDGISVCGVGGKTTTSSMIATVLEIAKRRPSFAIGVGEIFPLGVPGRYDLGDEFVAEADEYVNSPGIDNRPRFIFQNPKVIVATNVEFDHPDVYKNLEHTKVAFLKFFEKLPKYGLLLGCVDNPSTMAVAKKFSGNFQTYGFSPLADWRIEKAYFSPGLVNFNLTSQGLTIENICLRVPGKFNMLNATATFAVGIFLGISPLLIKKALRVFGGTRRRFEFVGEVRGIKLYDDYAHHPSEIKETLSAAREWWPENRLIVIFQPHTYSRTKALFKDFATAFTQADMIIIADIYSSAREKDDLGISSPFLVEEISKYKKAVFYKKGEAQVIDFIKKETRSGDIIFTLGAGNIFLWHQNILESLKN